MQRGSVRAYTICVFWFLLFAFGVGCVVDSGKRTEGDHSGGVNDECRMDEHCRELLVCELSVCQPSGAVEEGDYCELTADCVEGLFCSSTRACTVAGQTTEGGACGTTADCEAGFVCMLSGLLGRCQAAGDGDIGDSCSDETDCFAGLYCNLLVDGEWTCNSPPINSDPEMPPILHPWEGVECFDEDPSPVAYFEIPRGDGLDRDFYRLPFPNDIRRVGGWLDLSGHPHPDTEVGGDIVGEYITAIEEDVHGFSRTPTTFFRFSAGMDYSTISPAIVFINVTPDSPTYGEEHGYSWYATRYSDSSYICPNWVGISSRAGRPLNEGETYALILQTSLRTDEGDFYERDADFEAMLADSPPSDSDLSLAYEAYAPLRDWIADNDINESEILTAAVFTVQDTSERMSRINEVLRARSEPVITDLTLCGEGVTSPCADGTLERACPAVTSAFSEIHGRIELPRFQEGTLPYETAADGGAIAMSVDGIPIVNGVESVCFAMTIPHVAAVPEEGFPVVVYGHGTGGSFRDAVTSGLAGTLAAANLDGTSLPVATVAFDLPMHGDRRGGSELGSDLLFFNYSNPRAARDNVLQGAVDLISMIRWAASFSIDAADSPTGDAFGFNPDRVGLFAHSQGATHAALAVPYISELVFVIFSGEGGYLTYSLLSKTEPINIAGVLPFALRDADSEGNLVGWDQHPVLALFQTFFDVSDPVNYGGLLRPDDAGERPLRHVFMTYGLEDSYSTELTQQAYALAARFTLVEPVLTVTSDGEPDTMDLVTAEAPLLGNVEVGELQFTYGIRQYEPEDGDDGHFVSTQTELGQEDTLRFMLEALAGQVPHIGAP